MRHLLTTFLSAITAVSVLAQTTDASTHSSNKPFGWATCSSVDGSQYILNGGVGYGDEPKTITLTASGGDDDAAIKSAISKYDIIIFDGSKGDFIIASQIKIIGAADKTIVGINNARLCTKFVLTPDIHAALKSANLESLSSTNQMTGTLPDGQTVTMDERAFYTKKTMMEATGDNTSSFANSGIFAFDGSDENIIIRNLTFQGPGSVDVDGVDLISQYGGNHIWIDHCEFIDGMDGNLDTGKKEGMFVTYSWNIFRYTERSFSHPYSNGCGWLNDATEPQLFITYANCIWGAGCARRLPQVDATFLHLLNCYYNCAGNSIGCAVNGSNTVALIEGNYSESGVKDPILIDSAVKRYTTKGNYFASKPEFNDREYQGGVSVPYEYSAFSCNDVPSILTAANGAGATLDNDKVLPDVQAKEKPNVDVSGEYETFKKWDFTKWSTETKNAMAANSDDWTPDGNNFKFNHKTSDYVALTDASGKPFEETNGLFFKFGSADQTVVYTNSIRINKPNIFIKVPDCKAGDKLLITLKSANSSAERGFASDQTLPKNFITIAQATFEMAVVADGDVELYTPQGGIYLYSIELQRQSSTDVETIYDSQLSNHNYFNLNGQKVGADYKGFVIGNGKKILR